jgi:membrane-bound lytic murein transglycosylase A
VAQNLPLQLVNTQTLAPDLGWDEQFWQKFGKPGDRQQFIQALDHSLRYLSTNSAAQAYRNYPVPGISRDRVRRSLLRFRALLTTVRSPEELQAALRREFDFYQATGNDNQGTVVFTGYFEPTFRASRTPTSTFRYPLYSKPHSFTRWSKPHPTREQLEGKNGLAKNSPLKGSELVWLSDRLEAYLVQVQGSARLQMTDGTTMTVGYDGNTDYPYTSIGKELIKAGIFTLEQLSLPVLIDYLRQNPQELDVYLPRNDRFIFFRETQGAPPQGSIGVPVTAERSIATDKSLMPPGALVLLQTTIPYLNPTGQIESRLVSRFVLDQDTGSAIKGAGRVDIFMGSGKAAGDRAGLIHDSGQLYYLLLKP